VAITRGMDVRDVTIGVPPRAAAAQPAAPRQQSTQPPARPQPQGLSPQQLAFAGLVAGPAAAPAGKPRVVGGTGV